MSADAADDLGKRGGSRRVADLLQAAIDSGEYAAGDRLPSLRDLMSAHGVAMGTAREAVRLLEQEGRVEARTGSGVYVLPFAPDSPDVKRRGALNELREIREQLGRTATELAALTKRLDSVATRMSSQGG